MNILVARLNIARQLVQRAVITLAFVGVLALMGTHLDFVGTAALYAGVSVAHALWTILTIGGIRVPVTVPKKEKTPVGFVCSAPAASSADRVREARNQK